MGGCDLRIDLSDSTIPPDKLHGIRQMSGEVAEERAGGDDRLHTESRISARAVAMWGERDDVEAEAYIGS